VIIDSTFGKDKRVQVTFNKKVIPPHSLMKYIPEASTGRFYPDFKN
jgi:hypothetical protein